MVAPPKKYPRHQNPASYAGYTRLGSFCMNCLAQHRGAFASFPRKLTNARQLPGRVTEHACNWLSRYSARLQVVRHFSSGIVQRAKFEGAWKSPHARKGNIQQGERKMRDPHFSIYPSRVAFSRVGWFSRALAFCSLYYPWGKISLYSADQLFAMTSLLTC